jgi:RNA polymerase sigma factor (sigma-70 family)
VSELFDPVMDLEQCAAVRAGREALSGLVERHRPLVVGLVAEMNLPPQVDRDDLIQEGLIALAKAAEKFNPTAGSKFSTYAFVCVRNAVMGACGREANRTTSLNARPLAHEEAEYLDLLPAPERPEPPSGVRDGVNRLPPLLRLVVELHFGLDGEPQPLSEIAARAGLSVPQVRRALALALDRL